MPNQQKPIGTVQRWLITTGAGLLCFTLFFAIYAALAGISEAVIGREITNTVFVAVAGLVAAFAITAWLWSRLGRWLADRYLQRPTIFPPAPGSRIGDKSQADRYVSHGPGAARRGEASETISHLGGDDEIGDFIDITPEPPALDRLQRLPRPRK